MVSSVPEYQHEGRWHNGATGFGTCKSPLLCCAALFNCRQHSASETCGGERGVRGKGGITCRLLTWHPWTAFPPRDPSSTHRERMFHQDDDALQVCRSPRRRVYLQLLVSVGTECPSKTSHADDTHCFIPIDRYRGLRVTLSAFGREGP